MRSSLDGDKDPKHRGAARRRKVGIRIIAHETAGWTMRLCRTGMAGVSVKVKSGVFLMIGGWLAPSDWLMRSR